MIRISEQANQVLNIVKAQHNLHDKSEAIEYVVLQYGNGLLEPELKPSFVRKMLKQQKEKAIPVDDFAAHYGWIGVMTL